MSNEVHEYDKTRWQKGPWDNEPDKEQFYDEETPCLIVRNPTGALCGYAGVFEGHPWYEKDYDSVPADAHGGLTYSDHCQGPICHVPKEGEPKVWWLGFDCAHHADLVPGTAGFTSLGEYETYRDIGYVREQCRELARQIREAGR